eukprot:PhM_4_TR18036/c2_g1_i1/m.37315
MGSPKTPECAWRTASKGDEQWETTVGTVVRRSNPKAKDETRYADIMLPEDGVVLFPQDGKAGTLHCEYGLIEVVERKRIPPSPFQDRPEEPTRVQDRTATVMAPLPIHVPTVQPPPTMTQNEGGYVSSELPEYLRQLAQEVGDEPMTATDIGPGTVLAPKAWKLFRTSLEVYQAQSWIANHFRDLSKFPAEQHVFNDIVFVIQQNIALGSRYATLSEDSSWLKANERLIGRLYMQSQRKSGASAPQMAAMKQAFEEVKYPDWIQKARDSTNNLLRLQTLAGPQASYASKKPAPKKSE